MRKARRARAASRVRRAKCPNHDGSLPSYSERVLAAQHQQPLESAQRRGVPVDKGADLGMGLLFSIVKVHALFTSIYLVAELSQKGAVRKVGKRVHLEKC